jgi:hypothetical protein
MVMLNTCQNLSNRLFECFMLVGLKYEFNFAILVAGFKSLCHPHLNYYFKESSIPSLHVYGENDNIIRRGKCHSNLKVHCSISGKWLKTNFDKNT